MEIILSHNNLDCDGFASVLALSRLEPQAIPVLLGSLNRNVRDLLERYEGLLAHKRLRELPKEAITRLFLVDTQEIPADESLLRRLARRRPQTEIIDHHPLSDERPPDALLHVEPLGATTTLLVERMQQQSLKPTPAEATLLMLGVYEDTGHLTYTTTTPRDMRAAAWLLEQGADLRVVDEYIDRPLSSRQWAVYEDLTRNVQVEQISGYTVLVATAYSAEYVEELSTLAHKLTDSYEPDASFLLVQMDDVVQVIGRSRNDHIDVAALLKPLGGGGHAPAAAALLRDSNVAAVEASLRQILRRELAPAVSAADIMTRGLHTVEAGSTIVRAHAALRRYGHEALPIVDQGRLSGLIMRRDAEKAMQYGLGDRPVEDFATYDVPTVSPRAALLDIQETMRESNTGQVPVLDGDRLLGIVTRTDLLRGWRRGGGAVNLADRLRQAMAPDVFALLTLAGEAASELGYALYVVGGLVRDLLLGLPNLDLDLVVEGNAMALAERLRERYGGRLVTHTRFGTAKWTVAPGPRLSVDRTLALDFVTARTEFYEHPAALPQVEASSLRHDLYRRDFTINTMAICLNKARLGELIDFYGGQADLGNRLIRVLHNLSFVDDATRLLRAARLAERLGFTIETRTAALIPGGLNALDRVSGDRLRHELSLAFQEAAPERIIRLLDSLGVLRRLHPALAYSPWLADRYAELRRRLPQWRSWQWGNGGRGGDEQTATSASYMAILAYSLADSDLLALLERLNIGGEAGFILRQVWDLRQRSPELAGAARPSQVYDLLQAYPIEAIVVVQLAEADRRLHGAISSYVETLRHVRCEINGEDLRALGLPPGPLYGHMLRKIMAARLDGEVSSRVAEERLLRELLSVESN